MPGVKPNLGVNCIVGRLSVRPAGVAILEFDFLSDCRVFVTYGYRLNKAESYYKRRSRKNSVSIKRCR